MELSRSLGGGGGGREFTMPVWPSSAPKMLGLRCRLARRARLPAVDAGVGGIGLFRDMTGELVAFAVRDLTGELFKVVGLTGSRMGDGDLTRIFFAPLDLAFSSSSLDAEFTSVTLLFEGSRFNASLGLLLLCFCAAGASNDSMEDASRMSCTRLLGRGACESEMDEVVERKDGARVSVLRLVPMDDVTLKEVAEDTAVVAVKSEWRVADEGVEKPGEGERGRDERVAGFSYGMWAWRRREDSLVENDEFIVRGIE